jgi:predicted transposase YbfD/YdcC
MRSHALTQETQQTWDFPDARSAIRIRRETLRHGKWSQEDAYYLSSLELTPENQKRLPQIIRGHWGSIENRNHWVKDHCFKEDKTRSKNPNLCANLALLRNALLVLLQDHCFDSNTHAIEFYRSHPRDCFNLINQSL